MNETEPGGLPRELKLQMARHQAPPGLRRRVRFMLDQQAQAAAPSPLKRLVQGRSWPRWNYWLGLGASFACGMLLTVGLVRYQASDDVAQQFRQQLVANHVRSLMLAHKIDVASSDQHTVKPWFIGKVDYAPVVIDLAQSGFPLVGGRLDYLDGHAVAALVYGRDQHVINLFVRPLTQSQDIKTGVYAAQGYNLAGWTDAQMQFWAVTDASSDDLRQFMAAMSARATAKK
jgi:anti-sigma factor RsiW